MSLGQNSQPRRILDLKRREVISHDTLARTEAIIKQHTADNATSDSEFIADQLEPLDKSLETYPNAPASTIVVINSDSFTAARSLINSYLEAKGTTTVLNLASDAQPAGGWIWTLSKTQEEALCYSSTLYVTLKESYYPWPNLGPGCVAGVFSPGVVVFKDDLDHDCVDLELSEQQVVSVITVAAPRYPKLTKGNQQFKNASDLEYLQEKIRLVYRMAAHRGQQYLVLGAMGCGAYACPPRVVAEQMKSILLEPEFQGWFKQVTFAVYSVPQPEGSPTNFDIFSEIFKDTKTY